MGNYTYFVILADMRTGSNFLEASLNDLEDVTCYGEVFNPVFVGKHNSDALFGISLSDRDTDPLHVIDQMIAHTDGIPGFRLFNDHDPRVITHVLADPKCAKIRLTRDVADSFVSWKIAQDTNQWKLADLKNRRATKITFIEAEFTAFTSKREAFGRHIDSALQTTGQAAFSIRYNALADTDVLNGLAKFIGSKSQISKASSATKRQNPEPLSDKVTNYEDMKAAWSGLSIGDTDPFERSRGPNVRNFIVSRNHPIMFAPIPGSSDTSLTDWLQDTQTDLTQTELRAWQKQHRPHVAFTVLRHPVERAFRVYCGCFCEENEGFEQIAQVLMRLYKVQIPGQNISKSVQDYQLGFLSFLSFLKGNLQNQTSVRIDPLWAGQEALLRGIADFRVPDLIIHEADLQIGLDQISDRLNIERRVVRPQEEQQISVGDIYDRKVEKRVFSIYRKDYITFGFQDWRLGGG